MCVFTVLCCIALLVLVLTVHSLWCDLKKINEKPQVVNDYEAGRAVPNQQILSKLERALGEYNRFKLE